MLTFIFMGFLSAIALIIIMARISLRKFMGYPVLTDVVGSILFCIIFAGTMTGIMVAMIAALVLSTCIWLVRSLFGYERFSLKTRSWQYHPPKFV